MSLRYYLKFQHERMPLPIFFAGTVSSLVPYHTISVYFPRLNFNTMLIEKEIILSTN
jgi:hypothetical protein